MERTYNDAVTALNTLQTNAAAIAAVRKAGSSMNTQSVPEMNEFTRRIGYEPSDFDELRPIHIAGTKGKGSTSAFISSILTQYLPSPSQPNPLFRKIGLYTSPHLRFVRERIQINNEPLSEPQFAKYFFEVWDRLEASAQAHGEEPKAKSAKPSYFRFLTLMAFHTYMREDVDTAIIECGIGGEYDSTNIILHPSITGITSLGIDHVQILGETIDSIAWHKAGIMKAGAPAYTVPQPSAAQETLNRRANEKSVNLTTVSEHPQLQAIKLGLEAPFQRINASLAIEIAAAHINTLPDSPSSSINTTTEALPPEFIRGLEKVRWPGRCEIRRERGIAWHLDSGHTLESIQLAASWFASHIPPSSPISPQQPSSPPQAKEQGKKKNRRTPRILLFNQQSRDAPALVRRLHSTLLSSLPPAPGSKQEQPITHAIFTTNLTHRTTGYRPDLISMNTDRSRVEALEVQLSLQKTWRELDPEAVVEVRGSIEESVEWVRGVVAAARAEVKGEGEEEGEGEDVMCLVTGSTHLVGGFLEVLEGGGGGG
ncbi:MAG: hypothetical protein Q9220_006536 [cf. Caloplaca sp. 1 TL-2023]